MKVIFLADDFPPESYGGAGISTYELAKGFQKAGHEVSVITTSRTSSGEFEFDGLKIFKLKSNYHERWRAYLSLYNPQTIPGLRRLLKELQPDLVHINNVHYHLSYHSIKIAKKYSKKVFLTFRDAMSWSFGKLATQKYFTSLDAKLTPIDQLRQARLRWNPLRNFFIRRYVGYADKLLSVSSALKKALEQNGIHGVETLHTGIDLSEYKPSLPPGKNAVFYGGRLSKSREVVRAVMDKLPQAALVTAGGGGDWLSRDEMKSAYAGVDVVLVPSTYFDALPRMVLEAMASERPVIGTRYGGASEAIEDGVTGYVVDPHDIETVAGRIRELLGDPEKARRMGQAGRERIAKNFNLKDKIAQLTLMYEEID